MRINFSLHNMTAGFIAVLVGYTSSIILIIQAAHVAGANNAEISSWLLALGIGMSITAVGLSLFYKMPISIAWSTPGAALLITSLVGYTLPEAMGAFMVSAALIILTGITGMFTRIMQRIPQEIATAMLAGILLQFGIGAFKSMSGAFILCGGMFIGYLLSKKFMPRYCMLIVLILGIVIAYFQGLFAVDKLQWHISTLHFTMPQFSFKAVINISIPLFIVTMASQNLPGIAVLRSFNYDANISSILTWTGIVNFILAPFGAFALNLAAITAAICMGEHADPDPKKRYMAAVFAGIFYLILGIFGASVVALFTAAPMALTAALAGLALLGTIGASLYGSLSNNELREPALVTFLVTASGLTLFGIDSPLWGLFTGLLTLVISRPLKFNSEVIKKV